MGHSDLGLALAWFIPILLGILVGLVLLRFSDELSRDPPPRSDKSETDNIVMWHL